MLINTLILIIIANAITTIQEKSILYSRILILSVLSIIFIAYNNLFVKCLNKGIGLYNGLFNISTFTQLFNIFILVLAILILFLTAIYPNIKKSQPKEDLLDYNSYNDFSKSSTIEKAHIGVYSESFTIIEYALIIAFILCGALFLMSTGDLISLFLSIELQSYGLYILATLYRDSESATKSGLTYFLLGGLSSCFILLGSAILYVNSGTTNLDNIYIINSIATSNNYHDIYNGILYDTSYLSSINNNYEIYQANYINLSLTILIVGFLFKISAAPFHFWSPDVYDGIPTIVTTFVAIIAKISLFVILIELVTNMVSNNTIEVVNNTNDLNVTFNSLTSLSNTEVSFNEIISKDNLNDASYLGNRWKDILVYSSLASLVIGSLLGLTQYRIKRLFAYSTISHVGFILLALSVNKMESIQGYIFYILQYSISNLNAFLLIITIGYSLARTIYQTEKNENKLSSNKISENDNLIFIDRKNSPIQLLTQMNGYYQFNQFLALSLAITLFSFIGIPPLIGFFAKQMVLSAALDEGYVFMVLIGVITSVVGAGYYLNLVSLIFFGKYEKSDSSSRQDASTINEYTPNNYLTIIISILTMTITLFIFVPNEWFRIVSILSLSIFKL